MQTIKQTFSAGEEKPFHVPGRFFRILSCVGGVDLIFFKNGGVIGTAYDVDAGFAWRSDDSKTSLFDRIHVLSTVAQDVKFAVSDDPVSYDRMAGTISVINGEVARVQAGKCFTGVAALAGVVGSYSMCQLLNPAASGKNLILTKVSVRADAAGVYITDSVDPLTTDISVRIRSKLVGAGGSVAQLRHQAIVTFNGAYRYMNASTVGTKNTIEIPFAEPIVIPPGNSIVTGLDATGLSNDSTFQWTEEVI